MVVEKRMEHRGEKKINFGRTMMLELELLSLVKKHISGRSDVESAKIKPISLEFIKLHLSAI